MIDLPIPVLVSIPLSLLLDEHPAAGPTRELLNSLALPLVVLLTLPLGLLCRDFPVYMRIAHIYVCVVRCARLACFLLTKHFVI